MRRSAAEGSASSGLLLALVLGVNPADLTGGGGCRPAWSGNAERGGFVTFDDTHIDEGLSGRGGRRRRPDPGDVAGAGSWSHGSSEQRQEWFRIGRRDGDPDDRDAFGGGEGLTACRGGGNVAETVVLKPAPWLRTPRAGSRPTSSATRSGSAQARVSLPARVCVR